MFYGKSSNFYGKTHCVSTENTTFLRNSAALLQNNTAFAHKICYILRNEYYFLWKEDVPNGPPYPYALFQLDSSLCVSLVYARKSDQ